MLKDASSTHRCRFRLTPPQTITLGFAALVFLGACLLNLPVASHSGESIGFLDALFTATSATCVTGLIVVNTLEHWTLFGKVVILLLIQSGALGFMTLLTIGMLLLRRQISLRDRLVIQASFNQSQMAGMVRLVQNVVLHTFAIEAVGAVLLTIGFYFSSPISFGKAIWHGIFHSISAFCNAGFDIIGSESLVPFRANILINATIMALIVLGGLGFPVLVELRKLIKNPRRRALWMRVRRLSLHTKIVLPVTAALILGGALLFLVLEWGNPGTLGPLPLGEKMGAALFQSVTLRTAGFNTIDQGELTEISRFFSSILMIIGGSSAGTAGGMKTVTLGVIVISMVSVFKGRNNIEAFGRTLSLDLLQKALTVTATMLFVVLTSSLLLHFTELGIGVSHSFLDLLFETSSAAGTVGVTTGITAGLSSLGKGVLILCMFLGRLSPVTVVVALSVKQHHNNSGLTYPEERVIIG